MGNKSFLARLRKELPVWVNNGWVNADAQQAILDHVTSKGKDNRLLTYSITVLGILLLGAGIITFFAANWAVIPKLVKLTLLFFSMWISYGIACYLLEKGDYPHLGQAILLLGVILFGSNVMLIAQIYHIDSHYPNGVLLWGLCALAVAYLMNSQPCLIAAIALSTLWSSLETIGFDCNIHWQYLILWGACLPLIYQRQWLHSGHLAMIGLLFWSLISFISINKLWRGTPIIYFIQIFFLFYLLLFQIGMIFKPFKNLSCFSSLIRHYSLFAALTTGYFLTFPSLQGSMRGLSNIMERQIGNTPIMLIAFCAFLILTVLTFWSKRLSHPFQTPSYYLWGHVIIAASIVTILVNLFLPRTHSGVIAVIFNLVFFIAIIWLIYAGSRIGNRFVVNIAFVFFAIGLLTRYVDTFWSLMNRSLFFMGGGLILVLGGFYWERRRREIIKQIHKT